MILSAASSRAQGTFTASQPSPYETAQIVRSLTRLHATIDPEPDGKIVEDIDVVPLEVIEEDDPAPLFLNIIHTTTRITTIRREVLVEPGEPYRQYRLHVRVLIITKDVWSLRSLLSPLGGALGQ